MKNRIFFIAILIIELLSTLTAINYSTNSFLKYGSTDTVVYYIISHFGLYTINGEDLYWQIANSLGFDADRNSFIIGHQVYRFTPYLIIYSLSIIFNINIDLLVIFISLFINIIIIVLISRNFVLNSYKSKIVFLLLFFSIPYAFKMWITVPYALNYPLFVLFGLLGIKLYINNYYFYAFLSLLMATLSRQSGIIIIVAIFITDIYNKNYSKARLSFILTILLILISITLTTLVANYGYSDITNESVAGILKFSTIYDLKLFCIMVLKLIISFTPLIFIIFYYPSYKIEINAYLISGALLILQPLLGLKFTGLSISIVSGLAVPFILLGLQQNGHLKNILNKFISTKNAEFFFIVLALFLYTLQPSWDFIARSLFNTYNISYLHFSICGFIILISLMVKKNVTNESRTIY
jgi:hypothetical protein